MADHLVTEEIEVGPLLRTAPFRTTEELAVELPGRLEIVDRDREVEGSESSGQPVEEEDEAATHRGDSLGYGTTDTATTVPRKGLRRMRPPAPQSNVQLGEERLRLKRPAAFDNIPATPTPAPPGCVTDEPDSPWSTDARAVKRARSRALAAALADAADSPALLATCSRLHEAGLIPAATAVEGPGASDVLSTAVISAVTERPVLRPTPPSAAAASTDAPSAAASSSSAGDSADSGESAPASSSSSSFEPRKFSRDLVRQVRHHSLLPPSLS